MFALGATVYELATAHTLPSEGERWVALREGKLMMLPAVSQQLAALIKVRGGECWPLHTPCLPSEGGREGGRGGGREGGREGCPKAGPHARSDVSPPETLLVTPLVHSM